jgi:RNA polymerase sigma-70 factor, ECF subfamily
MTTPLIENAWADFVAHVNHFIRVRVANTVMAEEIVQDVLAQLQRRLEQTKKPETLRSWLHLMARKAIIDHCRISEKKLPESLEPSEDEKDELETAFRQIIHTLPRFDSNALLLTEFEGFLQEELAKHCAISLAGAKSRVQRGRKRLKRMLLDCCHTELGRHRTPRSFGSAVPEPGFHECPTAPWYAPEDNCAQEVSG